MVAEIWEGAAARRRSRRARGPKAAAKRSWGSEGPILALLGQVKRLSGPRRAQLQLRRLCRPIVAGDRENTAKISTPRF